MRSRAVPRTILDWSQDEDGQWVAALECGHRRHVRHRPPMSSYPWVETSEGRTAHLGAAIECGRCASREWPEGLEAYKVTREFDQASIPTGLLASHSTRSGTWGRLEVLEGCVTLVFEDDQERPIEVSAGTTEAIPPRRPHHLRLTGPVLLRVRFYRLAPASDA